MAFDALATLVPQARLETSPAAVAGYSADWSSNAILRGLRGALTPPAAVLRPSRAEDVAMTLAWASQQNVPVIAVGGGSGVSGATVTHGGELVIDMRDLNR